MSTDDQRRFIESIVTTGLSTGGAAGELADRLGAKGVAIAASAAFAAALARRYPVLPGEGEIASYAREVAESNRGRGAGDMLTPVVIEGMIRSRFGELHVFEDLTMEGMISNQIVITHAIVAGLGLDEDGRREFVEEAVGLIHQHAHQP